MSKIVNMRKPPALQHWVEAAQGGDQRAMRMIFDQLAPKMMGVCRRYLYRIDLAQEAVSTSFARAFNKLDELRETVQFESWFKSILIRECIDTIRREKRHAFDDLADEVTITVKDNSIMSELATEDLLKMIDSLPVGYKTIFNLFAIEGFGHKEIAGMLGISENTSKTQYFKAKAAIRSLVEQGTQKETHYGSY
ncbi:MAG: RNA polymerase sigma factor [Saprospiraceae bacterium]|nr:RNA polymerase sigma factor [Saprospiraceae bacterium]MCB9314131.1 RNA polymerase sigma factor [Lewinellaceae bacterium]HRW76499.1 RNA polymerase sigma factor [Saprospiraceae bacterium]